MSGAARTAALKTLAGQLDQGASGASDAARVRTLAPAVRELESAK